MDYKNISTNEIYIEVVVVNPMEDSIIDNKNNYNKTKDTIIDSIIINSKILFDIKNDSFYFALNKFYSILECKKIGINQNNINKVENLFTKTEISHLTLKDILSSIFRFDQLNIINTHIFHMLELRN